MNVTVVTLFPELFFPFLRTALLGKAIARGIVTVAFRNPRDFADGKHRSVDDTPYGGGEGMVMMAPPIVAALEQGDEARTSHRLLLAPHGKPFVQSDARRLAGLARVTLVCGRYEGVDARVEDVVDEVVSLGDFVLFGGEVAALAILEAVTRLLPGVLGNALSPENESFEAGLLEYPQFTRPACFRERGIPPVLLSGDHQAIARYRRRAALRRTQRQRPDLFAKLALSMDDARLLAEAAATDDDEAAHE